MQQDSYDVEKLHFLVGKVLGVLDETVTKKHAQGGNVVGFQVNFPCPDKAYVGEITLRGKEKEPMCHANVGVHRADSDRLVSNLFFFDDQQAMLRWIQGAETEEELVQTLEKLRARAFRED